MAKKIEVVINEEGESSIDLTGFHGKGCSKVMADFSGGERATLERLKPEYREQEKQQEKQRG